MEKQFDSHIKKGDALEPIVIKQNPERLMGLIIGAISLSLLWITMFGAILLDSFKQLQRTPHDSYTLTSTVVMGVASSALLGLFVWGMLRSLSIQINLFREKISFTGISFKSVEFLYSQIEWLQITRVLQGRNGVVSALEIVGINGNGEEQRFSINANGYDLYDLIILVQTLLKYNPNIQLDERAQLLRDGKPLPD